MYCDLKLYVPVALTSIPIGGHTFFIIVIKSIALLESLLVATSNQLLRGMEEMTCSLTVCLLHSASRPATTEFFLNIIISGLNKRPFVCSILG